MTDPYFHDDTVTLYHGDALAVLTELPSESVDAIVTSPPYLGLRDYGVTGTDWPAVTYPPMHDLPVVDVPAMTCPLGLEPDPAAYIGHLVAIFTEARRVLADDGVMWLNLGDSYSSDSKWGGHTGGKHAKALHGATGIGRTKSATGLPDKNLAGIPWRAALALQADGWILRNDIIWAKSNGMPESVRDRFTAKHEHVFLFAKSPRYWFDLGPTREPLAFPEDRPQNSWSRETKEADVPGQRSRQHRLDRPGKGGGSNLRPTGRQHLTPDTNGGRNPGDVWTIPTSPFPQAHYAVMAPRLAERLVTSGCKPGGVVLDPFSGAGTTGMVAGRHGRRYIGIDASTETLDLSLSTRLAQGALMDGAP